MADSVRLMAFLLGVVDFTVLTLGRAGPREAGAARSGVREAPTSGAEPAPELDEHPRAHDGVELLGHRLDDRPVAHVGLGALRAAPGHGVPLCAPVTSRPASDGDHFGSILVGLALHLDRELPADRWLEVNGRLARIESRQVQRAPGTPDEPGPVEKDAGPVDHPGAASGRVAEHPAFGRHAVVLEAGGLQCVGQRADPSRLLDAVQLGPDGAAAMAELGRTFGQDPEAATTPDAGPIPR